MGLGPDRCTQPADAWC